MRRFDSSRNCVACICCKFLLIDRNIHYLRYRIKCANIQLLLDLIIKFGVSRVLELFETKGSYKSSSSTPRSRRLAQNYFLYKIYQLKVAYQRIVKEVMPILVRFAHANPFPSLCPHTSNNEQKINASIRQLWIFFHLHNPDGI